MHQPDDLILVAKALERSLIDGGQAAAVLRELHDHPNKPAKSMFEALGLLDAGQLADLEVTRGSPDSTDAQATIVHRRSKPGTGGTTDKNSDRDSQPRRSGSGTDPVAATGDWTPNPPTPEIGFSVDTGLTHVPTRIAVMDSGPTDDTARFSAARDIDGIQRYAVVREFGRGGLGRVFLAVDQHLGREVAVKELLPRSLSSQGKVNRFFEEARITGKLDHPGIIPVHEFGLKPTGAPFYSMKLVRGADLGVAIKSYHALDADDPTRTMRINELLRIFVEICNAVGFAHDKGVLHRDLKPKNVMLGDFGEVLVVDWGLAKVMGQVSAHDMDASQASSLSGTQLDSASSPSRRSEETVAGTILGTPAYMSPEQAWGHIRDLDARSDIFSLGVILYEIITGKCPFKTKSVDDTLSLVRTADVPPAHVFNSGIPKALSLICAKAMSLDPADRYAAATMLGDDVERWLTGEPVSVFPDPFWVRAWRFSRRHRTAVTSTAVAVFVLILAGVAWQFRQSAERRRAYQDIRAQLIDAADAIESDDYRQADALLAQSEGVLDQRRDLPDLDDRLRELRDRLKGARHESLRRTAEQEITAGQQRLAEARLADARNLFDTARRRLVERTVFAGDNMLDELAKTATTLLAGVDRKLNDDAERAAVVRNMQAFRQAYDQALLYGTLFSGLDANASFEETSTSARAALDLCEMDPANGIVKFEGDRFLNDSDKQFVASACRLLLVILADVTARGDGDGKQQLQTSLALIDQARSIGLSPYAYHQARWLCFQEVAAAADAANEQRLGADHQPATAEDHFFGAFVYHYQGKHDDAIAHWRRSLQLSADQFWAHYYLAVDYLMTVDRIPENARLAVTHLLVCQKQNPNFAWAFILQGYAFSLLGEAESAHAEFQHAEQLVRGDSDRYGLHITRAAANVRLQRLDQADGDLNAAIALKPKGYEAYNNLAEVARKRGHVDKAMDHLNDAVRLAPNASSPYGYRAGLRVELANRHRAADRLEQEQAELDRALEDYVAAADRAVNLLEKAQFLLEQARILHRLGRTADAIARCNDAIDAAPNNADAYLLKGTIQNVTDQFALANLSLDKYFTLAGDEESVAAKPDDSADRPFIRLTAFRERGLARAQQRKLAAAMEDFTRATTGLPPTEKITPEYDRRRFAIMLARRGWTRLLHHRELALADFEKGVELFDGQTELPEHQADTLTGRGYARVLLGRVDEGLDDAERAIRLVPKSSNILYSAACIYGAAVGQLRHKDADEDATEQALLLEGKAIELLNRALGPLSAGTRRTLIGQIKVDEAFDSIRESERYRKLLLDYDSPPQNPN